MNQLTLAGSAVGRIAGGLQRGRPLRRCPSPRPWSMPIVMSTDFAPGALHDLERQARLGQEVLARGRSR